MELPTQRDNMPPGAIDYLTKIPVPGKRHCSSNCWSGGQEAHKGVDCCHCSWLPPKAWC